MASLSRLAEVGVAEVKGLGGKSSSLALSKAGVESVADLLHYLPRRYLDRANTVPIAEIAEGEEVTVIGEVRVINTRRVRKGLLLVEATVADDSGALKAVWFNQEFRAKQLTAGTEVALSGKVDRFRGSHRMSTPDVDVLGSHLEGLVTGRVVPTYRRISPIKHGTLRRGIHNALKRSRPIPDTVPVELRALRGLMDRDRAFLSIHFPETLEEVEDARRRLAYDELFRLELSLALRKRRQMVEATGVAHRPRGELVDRFLSGLPYRLTSAQEKALGEVESDLTAGHPMHRLLQGEVGSGKTVVAVAALLVGIEGGWQGAIMAPTEVLAEQHYLGVRHLLAEAALSPDPLAARDHLGTGSLFAGDAPAVHVGLLTGSAAACNYRDGITREGLLGDIASGRVDLVVGTHALIQEGVSLKRLGVAVIDEQHRFGVAQRVQLKGKADLIEPDMLILTATPIPRTLSMTLYGDLDVTLIDELPPGRTPVVTRHLPKAEEAEAWKMVQEVAAAGRQAFVVCPLVEDSPKVEAASAVAEHRRLRGLMAGLEVDLIHGQLRPGEKEEVMGRFRAGKTDVLVSTTVIEVGIDVPNATLMVVEDADRFGLSQLHQLRGRVGRGSHPGTCLLIADPTTEEAEQRLGAILATTDGFRLAEEDMRIRGYGTVFGTRQSGMKDLRVADILRDIDLVEAARRDAFALVESDPELGAHPGLAEELRAMLGDQVEWLFVS